MLPDIERSGALPIERMARLVGSYAWAERRAYEVLGALAADEPDPAARLFLDVASRRHSGHAALFAELLPILPGLSPAELTAAPPASAAALDALGALPGTIARLAGVSRAILPRLVAGYRSHLVRTVPVADAPLRRGLRLVAADEEELRAQGEDLLERLGAASGGLEAADRAASALVSGLGPVTDGLVPGPG